MNAYEVIIKPVLTEKSYAGIQAKMYTFIVNKEATKVDIKNAVKEIFKVDVAKVNTMNYKATTKIQNTRAGRTKGKTSAYKKAIVTLKADSKPIEFFESLK